MLVTRNLKDNSTLLGCLALVLWSFSAVLIVSLNRIPIFELLFVIHLSGFLYGCLVINWNNRWSKLKQPLSWWIIGVCCIACNDIFYVLAFKNANVAEVDLISYLWPVFVVILNGFMPNEKFTVRHILASFIGFYGCYYLFSGENFHFEPTFYYGYFYALIAAIAWAVYTLFSKYKAHSLIPETVSIYIGFTAIIMLILHFSFYITVIPTLFELSLMIIMGFLCHGAAYILWSIGVKSGNFKLLSILAYGNPILSVFLLILFSYAEFSSRLLIASVLVSLGGFIAGLSVRLEISMKAFMIALKYLYFSNFSVIVQRNLYKVK